MVVKYCEQMLVYFSEEILKFEIRSNGLPSVLKVYLLFAVYYIIRVLLKLVRTSQNRCFRFPGQKGVARLSRC